MRASLRRILSTLGVVALVTTFFTASPSASAEPTADTPELTSFSADPGPYRPGDIIEFHFAISHVDDLNALDIEYRESETGHLDHFTAGSLINPATGASVLRYTVPTAMESMPFADVTYSPLTVSLQDREGRWTRYRADGSLTSSTLPGNTHTVPFTSDVSFVDSPRDHTPPVLKGLTISPLTVEAGAPVTISYSASDPALYSVSVLGFDETNSWTQLAYFAQTALPTTGSTTWSYGLPQRVRLARVDVADRFGNVARYYPDGRLTTGAKYNYEANVTTHSVALPTTPITVRGKAPVALTAEAVSTSVRLRWSQQADLGHRIVVSPGGKVLTGAGGEAARDVLVTGLNNGTAYSFSVVATSPVADSLAGQVTATPRMSMRVFGTGNHHISNRGHDLWAAPRPGATEQNRWLLFLGLGGGAFGSSGLSHISADLAPLPGSANGRGPGAPLGAMYLSGSSLVEPTPGDPRVIGKGFNIFRTIDASSDLTGDGIADLFGITPAGDFYLYTSTSTGAIGRGVRLGSGWGTFHTVFSPGDFNGDTRSDLVAVDGLGKLWLYPGNGRGGFGARVGIGSGWAGFGSVLPMRDFSGDGRVDLGAITTDGKLRMYPGNGRGGFLTSSQIGTGWGAFL